MIQIGGGYTTFCQEEGIPFAKKYRDRNGRCIAILFESIGVRGRLDPPDNLKFLLFQTETGTGTAGTIFQEMKLEAEPSFSC